MRKPLIAGNWKMNLNQRVAGSLMQDLIDEAPKYANVDFAIFPSYVYLMLAQRIISGANISFGAQDVSVHVNGAYTGEISAEMLLDVGCRSVIVGHSERREYHHESNELVARKALQALASGLQVIVCVGETLEHREASKTLDIIAAQLASVLAIVDNRQAENLTIAYEPVWAIGTGKVATPEQAEAVHLAIREQLVEFNAKVATTTRILYGGSVKPNNAAAIFAMPNIDGALVGGASLQAKSFLQIGEICNNLF